jgi:hypothetical protein
MTSSSNCLKCFWDFFKIISTFKTRYETEIIYHSATWAANGISKPYKKSTE